MASLGERRQEWRGQIEDEVVHVIARVEERQHLEAVGPEEGDRVVTRAGTTGGGADLEAHEIDRSQRDLEVRGWPVS